MNSDSNSSDLSFVCKDSRISLQNKLKRAAARQLIEETRVCDYLSLYTDDVNRISARAGESFVLGLEFKEPKKEKHVSLNKFDPIAADFVKELKWKIGFANRHMLKSFRLKLVVQEVAA